MPQAPEPSQASSSTIPCSLLPHMQPHPLGPGLVSCKPSAVGRHVLGGRRSIPSGGAAFAATHAHPVG